MWRGPEDSCSKVKIIDVEHFNSGKRQRMPFCEKTLTRQKRQKR